MVVIWADLAVICEARIVLQGDAVHLMGFKGDILVGAGGIYYVIILQIRLKLRIIRLGRAKQ